MRKKALFIILGVAILELVLFAFFEIYTAQFKLSFSPYGYDNDEAITVSVENISKERFESSIGTYKENTKKCKSFPTFASYINCQGFFYEEYKHYDWGWDYKAVIYLECYYEIFEFESEIERIKSFIYNEKTIVYVDDLFSLPAYVVAYNWDSLFEYMLIDKDNYSIRYVYLFDSGKNVSIPENYFPKKILRDSSFPNQGFFSNGYNCYASK